jgi:2-hydroxychromene-2-carboxylate isomerase
MDGDALIDGAGPMDGDVFLYDFNSPYAYLAATRVDRVLPRPVRWEPIAFAFILRAHDRRPWSFDDEPRRAVVAECERRARAYGLPQLRWPPGWPVESYGLASLRAALVASDHGLLREFSMAAFGRNFVEGLGLARDEDVLAVASSVGLDRAQVAEAMGSPAIKQRLTAATEAAIAGGVVGVPTVVVGGEPFWGDDRLADAAARAAAAARG